jgi:hypothetical protein
MVVFLLFIVDFVINTPFLNSAVKHRYPLLAANIIV